MVEHGAECESFKVISTDSLFFHLQVYLENCAYKIVNKQIIDNLGEHFFESN